MRKSILAVAAMFALSALAPVANAADTLRVPKTTWKQCGGLQVQFCIQSIAITPIGFSAPVELTWVPSGKTLNPPAPVVTETPTVTDTTTVTDTATVTDTSTAKPVETATTPAVPEVEKAPAGVAMTGMFSHVDWPSLGLPYDGIFVDVKAANDFTNTIFLNVVPVVADPTSYKTFKAVAAKGSVYQADLAQDITIVTTLNVGNFVTGVTLGAGQNVTVDASGDAGNRTFVIKGEPSRLPLAAKTADCTGETGKAVATSIMMQAYLFPTNDTAGFGIPGVSGDLYLASNGLCLLSPPVWNNDSKELTWTAAAPHFAPDGTTINRGFFRAVIPIADAKLLWGLENPNDAATALQVSAVDEGGVQIMQQSNISVKANTIVIDYSGYQYSKPTMKIKKNPKYVPSKTTAVAKKTTITCVKGKLTKKVTAVNPKCPTGYKKK